MSTVYEEAAREKKCLAVARQALNEAAGVLENGDEEMWRILAERADCKMPSEESKRKIIELLKGARLG